MSINYDLTFDKVLDQLKEMVKTETIVGEPFKLDEFVCVPVIKVGVGFGSGGVAGNVEKDNSGKGLGGGAAAGMGISPIGFLVSRGEEISFISSSKSKGWEAIFDKVPDLMDKIVALKDKKKAKS
ncbi:GerW family sporulation protein [Bacteroidota bacterium]